MVRIAIVEDDDACRAQLEAYVRRCGGETGVEFQITSFSDGLTSPRTTAPSTTSSCWTSRCPGWTAWRRRSASAPSIPA